MKCFLVVGLFCSLALISEILAAPYGELTSQGAEETQSTLRSRILLNGVWNFQPSADASAVNSPKNTWGKIAVPGSWINSYLPRVLSQGDAPIWKSDSKQWAIGWYERKVKIPDSWAGRSVILDLRKVSTDADIYVNGVKCGTVNWPFGEVVLSPEAKAGQEITLSIKVTALADEGESLARMGYAVEKSVKNELQSAGLIGEVWLLSRPIGPTVSDIFVKPSYRKKEVELEVELSGVKTSGQVSLVARFLDESGKEEIKFESAVSVKAAGTQVVSVKWPWANPRLWDLNQPNLYTLILDVNGAGIKDAASQRFGFKELWIQGRDFYLNGSIVRWRPAGGHGAPKGLIQINSFVKGSREAGFNISQIWPNDNYARSSLDGDSAGWEYFAERASELGWPIIAPATHFSRFLENAKGETIWNLPQGKERYEKVVRAELKRYRNEPSVMMYATTANINNWSLDQNPRYIGQQKISNDKVGKMESFEAALATIRTIDPLRPVFIHAGNRTGDVYAVNHYLNLIPLQEREEWFSDYSKNGDVPYMGVEFGTPFNTNMNRGRTQFGDGHVSEPLLSEHTAAYLGTRAYTLEPREYRRNIRFGYNGKDWGGDWDTMQKLQSTPPAFQEFQSLFVKNTWRAWRTAGVTGGMIPWNFNNQLWTVTNKTKAIMPDWTPQTRGIYYPEVSKKDVEYLQPTSWEALPAAKTLISVNNSTLAWIAGNAETFTEKSHHFNEGQTVNKQIVLINDQRTPQPFSASWTVSVDDKIISTKDLTGEILPGTNQFFPVTFNLPPEIKGTGVGAITLKAKIGSIEHQDTFAFTVFKKTDQPKVTGTILVFDPVGKTSALLKFLGVSAQAWDGKKTPSANTLLIIGREVFSANHTLPGKVEEFVRSGGRVLIMTQHPDYFRGSLGLRVSRFQSRRVFKIDPLHPVFNGLTDENLCNWSGQSTLIEPYPEVDVSVRFNFPPHGWRWGSRHTVSSSSIEKPHLTGWRPLLESEFDLAYSPLMELDLGLGRVTLCTLDLEDQAPVDPAAEKLARQLLSYAATAPLKERASKTIYFGSEESYKKFLALSGVIAEHSAQWPASADSKSLIIVSSESTVSPADLNRFTTSGGRALFLARTSSEGAPKPIKNSLSYFGSSSLPKHSIYSGLSLSDLRLRSEIDWLTLSEGTGVEANGLVATEINGSGLTVFTQINPTALNTEKFPWLRYTRWRQTRALNQIIGNLGAEFVADKRIFNPLMTNMPIDGSWKMQLTAPLPLRDWRKQEKPHDDPGMSAAAKLAVEEKFDDSAWKQFTLPSWYPPLNDQSGEYVARRTIQVPPEWNGQVLRISLGRIKSYDSVYWNGQPIGSTDAKTPDSWNLPRRYRVPGNLVRSGTAVISVRGFSPDFQGGIHGSPNEMSIQLIATDKMPAPFYHTDYKEDHSFGDEPYRYYRW